MPCKILARSRRQPICYDKRVFCFVLKKFGYFFSALISASTFLTIASVTPDGNGFVVTGTGRRGNDPFTLRLAPRGSGTEGRLLLVDND